MKTQIMEMEARGIALKEMVAFKGKPDHLEMRLADGIDFSAAKRRIEEKLKAGGKFFVGSEKVRIVGALSSVERVELLELLQKKYGVLNVEFEEKSNDELLIPPSRNDNRRIKPRPLEDLHTLSIQPQPVSAKKVAKPRVAPDFRVQLDDGQPLGLQTGITNVRECRSLVINETVRNGQRISFDGDILVLGDVNFGAELVATGHIAIMGALRGKAHAGSSGDMTATVSAGRLSPQQLRIGSQMAIAPENPDESIDYPEIACVNGGEIVVSPLCKAKNARGT